MCLVTLVEAYRRTHFMPCLGAAQAAQWISRAEGRGPKQGPNRFFFLENSGSCSYFQIYRSESVSVLILRSMAGRLRVRRHGFTELHPGGNANERPVAEYVQPAEDIVAF